MSAPEDTPSGLFLGFAVALVLAAPFWVAVFWMLSQPLAWWLVS